MMISTRFFQFIWTNTYSRTSTPAAGTHRDLKAERCRYQAAERFKLYNVLQELPQVAKHKIQRLIFIIILLKRHSHKTGNKNMYSFAGIYKHSIYKV